ncbi:GGDEF domain-containing protein [Dactylosporangium roseum]|uniref:GGDEF domain-containing protein n=1 Tax=Dactylosporangium roseum TaxID=47989 RepID=A0ABY5ZAG5_9ACTN|nr:GGDEF domain-containing protein [Dactylosporangium roseum]UWZ38852.1 GGDEF domain-containing protein [Dactylosporangium roseum]
MSALSFSSGLPILLGMSGTLVVNADQLAATVLEMEADRRTADHDRAMAAERAAVELGRPDLAARARLLAADALCRRGDLTAAAPLLHEVHRWAVREGERFVLARSHFLLAILHTCLGDNAEARRHALLSVDHLPDDAPPLLRGRHLVTLALAFDSVSRADAAPYHAEALDIAAAAGDHELSRSVLNNMAYAAYQAGDVEAAGELAERMRGLVARTGVVLRPCDLDTLARVLMLQGRFAQAEATLLPSVAPGADWSAADAEGDMLPEMLLTLAEAQRLGGALDRASATIDRCFALCAERGTADTAARTRRELARLHAAHGRFREAYEEQCRYDEESQALRSAEREEQARLTQFVFESREGRRESARFREMALRDALTGIYNRRFVDAQLPSLIARAAERGTPLSAALVDVDFFKRVNDTLSHEVGDLVLQRIAALMSGAVEEPATVARLGGEEFVVVLPEVAHADAASCCEAIRLAVQRHDWRDLTGDLPVTVSVGVTTTLDGRTTAAALLSQADRNLYAAKRSGRNRVMADPG